MYFNLQTIFNGFTPLFQLASEKSNFHPQNFILIDKILLCVCSFLESVRESRTANQQRTIILMCICNSTWNSISQTWILFPSVHNLNTDWKCRLKYYGFCSLACNQTLVQCFTSQHQKTYPALKILNIKILFQSYINKTEIKGEWQVSKSI